ncbi:MAG: hypothetical protein OHK0056_09510 [Bacteriovoracaceae bacterium]
MLKVAKFGGSSVRDAIAMQRVVDIVNSDPEIKVVVISATQNTTNDLENIAQLAKKGEEQELKLAIEKLEKRHLDIAIDLKIEAIAAPLIIDLSMELKTYVGFVLKNKDLTASLMDNIYAIGERMSSLLVAHRFKVSGRPECTLFDVRQVMITDNTHNSANPIIDLIQVKVDKILKPLLENHLIVTQGFIGTTENGETTVLGREGSDFSATLLGESLAADLVQIWTDVPGVASTDPRVVQDVVFLKQLSYKFATLLAKLGAKVLYSRTLEPAERKSIPVQVLSSLDPKNSGTIIQRDVNSLPGVLGITFKKRGEESVVSIVGNDLEDIQIDSPEVDRGENYRSFLVETKQLESTVSRWHSAFVHK